MVPARTSRDNRDMSSSQLVHVDLGSRSYNIEITSNRLADVGSFAKSCLGASWTDNRLAFVVTDSNVVQHADAVIAGLEEAGWRTGRFIVPAGEESKNLRVAEAAFEELASLKADRRSVVVAVGGGVVGDLAGFVAASWGRGVPFVQVPTTLLADVDSSVGGKTGVNIAAGKNLVGAFHQPLGVFIDTATLESLPSREFASGMAEVIKYGVILDEEFFAYLEDHFDAINDRDLEALQHIIARSCRLKADVVEQDEEERTGLRAILNYGHTFAHAYEALLGYGTLLHGEAVAIGMIHAGQLAEEIGLVDAEFNVRQLALIEAFGLPTQLPSLLDVDAIVGRMRIDKKSLDGEMRFILPERLGKVRLFDDVAIEAVTRVLKATSSP